MFSKFSKFRSKGSSHWGVPNQELISNGRFSSNHDEHPVVASPDSPLSPKTPPQIIHKIYTSPNGKHGHKPSLPIAPTGEYMDGDSDLESNVSFAETLFPVTPLHDGGRPRKLNGSFTMMEEGGSSPDIESRLKLPPAVMNPLRNNLQEGRRSSGSKKSWDMDNSNIGELDSVSKRSWNQSESNKMRSYETNSNIKRGGSFPSGMPGRMSTTSSSVPEEEEIDIGPAVLPSYDDAEEDFLEEFDDYFDNLGVDNVRREQYPKLDEQRLVYLDYASFALYSRFQVEEHMKILLEEGPCLGSAFMSAPESRLFTYVSDTQERLLRMLNTNRTEYSIIFTAGFQESFQVVAEAYPFQRGSPLLVCQDNHAAVRQVIICADRAGGKPTLAPVADRDLTFHSHELRRLLKRQAGRHISNGGLFIYPAQSNLTGIRHSLNWVAEAQQNGWHVCVDATTLLPTGSIDLKLHQPDFLVGSFHHMVGYPSGMGFLLVKRDSFCVQALSSGKVELVRNQPADEGEDCHLMCPTDNNMNLLQFAALGLGLRQLETIGLVAIQKRVNTLSKWLLQRLRTLRHKDEEAAYLIRVYGSHATQHRGSIVSFNVMDSTGTVLPPDIVRKLALRCNITLSVGNFNNPGLANALGMPNERSNDVGIVMGNWGFMAVRASLGPVSNFSDVYRLVHFLSRFRDEEYLSTEAMEFIEERNQK